MRVFELKAKCVCRYCGKTFLAKTNRATVCDNEECRKKQRSEWNRNTQYTCSPPKKKAKTLSNKTKWKNIIQEVEKSGLSYGQYFARKDNAGL